MACVGMPKGAAAKNIKAAMAEVQAYARSHGGEIHLVEISKEGVASIRMVGACDGCPLAGEMLNEGVKSRLTAADPSIKSVVIIP